MTRITTILFAALLMTGILLGSSCQPDRITPAQIAQQKAAQKKLAEQNKPAIEEIPQPVQKPAPVAKTLPPLKAQTTIPESLPEKAPGVFYVKLECSTGEMLFKCNTEWAPIGAQHFYDLVNVGFYNDCRFFRVVTKPRPFVIQFGLPANPALNDQYGTNILDEPVKTSNKPGTITFAKSGAPNSRSTQLFINLADNSNLDAMGFSPFAEIAEGSEAIKGIYSGYGGSPSNEQNMIKMQGNAFLNQKYPKLSYIKKAYVVNLVETTPAETNDSEPAPEASGSDNKEQ